MRDILVYDPVGRDVWYWDTATGGLLQSKAAYRFQSRPVELNHQEVFRRLDEEVR